jgi:hypothetical protein
MGTPNWYIRITTQILPLKKVEIFNYLYSILNVDNVMNIKIAERIKKAINHTMGIQK